MSRLMNASKLRKPEGASLFEELSGTKASTIARAGRLGKPHPAPAGKARGKARVRVRPSGKSLRDRTVVVIVAPEDDPHAQAVARALGRMGREDVFWVDLENAPETLHLTWEADRTGIDWVIGSQVDPAKQLSSRNISSIYWRRIVRHQDSPLLKLATSANFDRYELFWSLRWLLESLPGHLFPLGHPIQLGRADNKHRQMLAALRAGFRIPETSHSNDPAALRRFIEARPEVALKGLKMPGVTKTGREDEARHLSCKTYPSEFLLRKLRGRERTQLFCQEAIHRPCDLRIMVFPHEIIAAEIDTSTLPDNQLDWREDCDRLRHRMVSLPRAFGRQLREFLAHMDLKAGYFDFARPEQGPPVFFECNTNAQWYWIEHLTGHPISEAIARALAAP